MGHMIFLTVLCALHAKLKTSVTYISVLNCFGPMARDMDGIVQAMRALWDGYMFDLDPSVVPMTFNEQVLASVVSQFPRSCNHVTALAISGSVFLGTETKNTKKTRFLPVGSFCGSGKENEYAKVQLS